MPYRTVDRPRNCVCPSATAGLITLGGSSVGGGSMYPSASRHTPARSPTARSSAHPPIRPPARPPASPSARRPLARTFCSTPGGRLCTAKMIILINPFVTITNTITGLSRARVMAVLVTAPITISAPKTLWCRQFLMSMPSGNQKAATFLLRDHNDYLWFLNCQLFCFVGAGNNVLDTIKIFHNIDKTKNSF